MQFTPFNLQTAGQGKFVLEPLPQGYGHTLGNSLRRVLYTSIKGSAITYVQITNANHQFTTIEGVQEDVVQLILNLKQIRVSSPSEDPIKITLATKGPGEVKAGDFETPGNVKIANPNLVIAHLADKTSKLEIEATVESGYGYSPAEDRKSNTVGLIPVDAAFTPVLRVNYNVEATRVGRVTNFDKLVLDITTDGTISPEVALKSAASTLVDYFGAVVNPSTLPTVTDVGSNQTAKLGSSVMTIEELDLPTRIANALVKAGFNSVADLQAVTLSQLAKVKNLGSKSAKLIEQSLAERDISLA